MGIRHKNTPPAMNFKRMYNQTYGEFSTRAMMMTPEQLYDLACRYFDWAEKNAINASETASFQGVVNQCDVTRPRVFTITGFSLFSGVSQRALANYRDREGYAEVMDFIDTVIHEQKYQLAANNMINSGIVGKELGIDKGAQINVSSNAAAAAVSSEEKMVEAIKSVLGEI